MTGRVPVIALTGHLGAGKTTVLNHLLRQPGSRVGVVVNDFGDINVDAALVTGQVDEPASITGGCLCCLPDAGGLDHALETLTHPRLGLDAVIVEASGFAEPAALAHLIRYSGVARVRPGGVVEVVDALQYDATVDPAPHAPPPARFAVSTLVLVNKCDRLSLGRRRAVLDRVSDRVRQRNPHTPVVAVHGGRVDPTLVYDVTHDGDHPDQLPLGDPLPPDHGHGHRHADAVSVRGTGPVEPSRVLDLLHDPPGAVYRVKGRITIDTVRGPRRYVVHLVGRTISVHADADAADGAGVHVRSELVAIGLDLDLHDVRRRLDAALAPSGRASAAGYRELHRYRTLSL